MGLRHRIPVALGLSQAPVIPGKEFTKHAPLSRKHQIDARLAKLYRPELLKPWNAMLDALTGTSPDDPDLVRKALQLLED